MRFVLLYSLLSIYSINAFGHREKTYYLHGWIDSLELVLQIDEYGDECMARYTLGDERYDRILEGKIIGNGKFSLIASKWNSELKQKEISDSIFIEEPETDVWKGRWKYKNGQSISFNLKPILIDSLNHPYQRAVVKYNITPFLAYKTRFIHFKPVKKEKIAKHIYIEHVVDPTSNITWFRVLSTNKNKLAVDSINDKLLAEHLNAINSKFSCVHMDKPGNYTIRFKVHLINEHLISYTTIINSACYGQPEEDVYVYNNYKIHNAQPVMMEELYWFGEQPQPSLISGEYEWFQYRYKKFGPAILDLLTQIYPEHMITSEENDCKYDNVKLWQFPDWYLTKKGLFLKYKSPVRSKCEDTPWSVLSYEILKPYEANDFGLNKK